MENATKALTMAGGILIAIMVLATLLYAATTWGIIPTTKDETDAAKQLAKFNQEYESYDRDALYGTDLVSVLNKAIDNNKKYNVKGRKDPMCVDIHFKLINNVLSTEITYRTYYTGPDKGKTKTTDGPSTMSLPAKTYKLFEDSIKIENFINNFEDTTRPKNYQYGFDEFGYKYRQYLEIKPDVSEFKTRVFTCVETHYNDDGRIDRMVFTEVDTSNQG